jgi:hypothetical protein
VEVVVPDVAVVLEVDVVLDGVRVVVVEHPWITVRRQPKLGVHVSMVQGLPSSHCSIRQKSEQPSQLAGIPGVSHVSG